MRTRSDDAFNGEEGNDDGDHVLWARQGSYYCRPWGRRGGERREVRAMCTHGDPVRWLSSDATVCVLPGSGGVAQGWTGLNAGGVSSHLPWAVREPSMLVLRLVA